MAIGRLWRWIAATVLRPSRYKAPSEGPCLTVETAPRRAAEYLATIGPYPDIHRGRGIVTCAGGPKFYPCAWVLIKMLRMLGCRLPIQVWYLGRRERDQRWIELVEPLGVECVDAHEVCKRHPHRHLGGWESKAYGILHSSFEEVLFLDADNVPIRDPTYLFHDPRYRATGAIFWPDVGRTPPRSPRWRIFGLPYRDEPEQESGQILIHKRICWKALNLCTWYSEHSDFFYRFIHGDKDTFRFAWHRVGQPYVMPNKGIVRLRQTFCQHDLDGRRLFQHRCRAKWSLHRNHRIRGSRYERQCEQFLDELRRLWQPAAPRGVRRERV